MGWGWVGWGLFFPQILFFCYDSSVILSLSWKANISASFRLVPAHLFLQFTHLHSWAQRSCILKKNGVVSLDSTGNPCYMSPSYCFSADMAPNFSVTSTDQKFSNITWFQFCVHPSFFRHSPANDPSSRMQFLNIQ